MMSENEVGDFQRLEELLKNHHLNTALISESIVLSDQSS